MITKHHEQLYKSGRDLAEALTAVIHDIESSVFTRTARKRIDKDGLRALAAKYASDASDYMRVLETSEKFDTRIFEMLNKKPEMMLELMQYAQELGGGIQAPLSASAASCCELAESESVVDESNDHKPTETERTLDYALELIDVDDVDVVVVVVENDGTEIDDPIMRGRITHAIIALKKKLGGKFPKTHTTGFEGTQAEALAVEAHKKEMRKNTGAALSSKKKAAATAKQPHSNKAVVSDDPKVQYKRAYNQVNYDYKLGRITKTERDDRINSLRHHYGIVVK